MSDKTKGYLLAVIATLAFSNVYIFSKAALNEIHLAQFGVYWFTIGTVLNLLLAFRNKKLAQIRSLTRSQVRILVTLGILEILTTTTFFLSIHIISDPSVTSFLGNMYPVMVTLGGVFILGEKFGMRGTLGAIVALAGAFIISYTGETSLENLFIRGTGVVLINAIFAASATLVVKVHVKKLSPEFLTLNRSVWLLFFSIIMLFCYGQQLVIPVSALKNIAVGAILGPFLAILTVYYSMSYIDASRSSIVQSLKGIFVLIGAFLYFGTFPLFHQVFGGILTIAGVIIMTFDRVRKSKQKNYHENILEKSNRNS